MAKQSVTIEGVQYKSRTEAAKALVAAGKTLSEAASATGMTYQTVYANTKGADKVNQRRAKYRVLAMGKSGKRSPGEIAKKVGLNVSKVVAILKGAKITVVTKAAKAESKKATKKAPKQKVTKPENVIDVPEAVAPAQDSEIPENDEAMAAALADMNDAQ